MRFQAVFCPVFLTIALTVFQSKAGEPSAPTNASSTSTNTNDDFDTLVKRGDQARISRDYLSAVKAYRDAIALREDTLIEGRLGLLLFEMRAFDVAAQHLQHAMERPSKAVSDAEYAKFSNAFRAAQKEVCRLDIAIDHLGARFELDGDLLQQGKGEFWFFVMPGKHNLRVILDGFEDEIQELDAPKGEQEFLKFILRPIAQLAPKLEKSARIDPAPAPKPIKKLLVPEDKPPSKTNTKPRGQFVVGGGLAFVLGPTPKPALGPQLFGAWRSRSWWEIGLDARVGWTLVEDERFSSTKFVTWSAGITPCARVRSRFFGCGLLQVEGVARDDGTKPSSLPGVGLRAGVDFPLVKSLHLQLWGDVSVRPQGFRFSLDELSGSMFTGTFGLRGAYLL